MKTTLFSSLFVMSLFMVKGEKKISSQCNCNDYGYQEQQYVSAQTGDCVGITYRCTKSLTGEPDLLIFCGNCNGGNPGPCDRPECELQEPGGK